MADPRRAALELPRLAPWQWALAAGAIVIVLLGLFVALRLYLTRNDLPGCTEQPTRQTLATIFRENNVAASSYDETQQLSRSDTEVACTVVVTLADGGKLDVTYRMLREEGRSVVRASWTRRTP